MGISVILLTYNSEHTLAACLESVKWADEIIALDADSTDATRRILAEYGATIQSQPLDAIRAHRGNFDVARNLGFAMARNDWVLVLDSDEEVSTPLRDEIRAVTGGSAAVAYLVPRLNLFWDRPTAVLGRDFQLRLFPRGKARYEGCHLDARPVVRCPVEHLTQPLFHHQGRSLRQLIGKLHRRTSQRARVLHAEGRSERERIPSLFYWTFRYHYRELGASAEGLRGVVLSFLFAAYPTLTQCKLRLLDARSALGFVQDRLS